MNAAAKAALSAVRDSLAAGRYLMTIHFRQRLSQRGILWADILTVFDSTSAVRSNGRDDFERPKWLIVGPASDGLAVEVVCVLDHDDIGRLTVLITVYFEK